MPLFQVVILGIVQGLTEFLPISSSAHLALIPWLFGWKDQGLAFDIALHFGTLAAVIAYFFRDWLEILANGFRIPISGGKSSLRENPNLLWYLVLATIPIGAFGFLVKKQAETTWRNPYLIGSMLIGIGLFMWLADRVGQKQKALRQLGLADALIIGAAQALAAVPGTSRSGVTISAGLLRQLKRSTAARFSFLMSAPAIAGAAAKDFYDLMKHEGGIPLEMRVPFILGIAVSAITGAITIKFFMDFLRTRSLNFFVCYRVVFGIIVIALAMFFRYNGG